MGEFCKNIELELNQTLPVLDFIKVNVSSLVDVCREIETEDKYSEPMVAIGYYIMIASTICLYAIMLDLSYDFGNHKFWFPCKYFSLNATTITIIAVAIKLPMDLNSPMPGFEDQVAKLGGLAFMCVMMSNLMPSLASMDNKSLFANVTGLSILVITLIVDVGIQIKTQLIFNEHPIRTVTCIYMGMLLFLLIIFISSAVTIPSSKKVLEFKYQAALKNQNPQENVTDDVETLKQHVKKYWMMTKTSSPQFVAASTPLSSASGIVCATSMLLHIYLLMKLWATQSINKKSNVYKQSMPHISMIQIVVVLLGSFAPISRCFTVLSFKSFGNRNWNHFSVFKLERYWTQTLCEWKESHLSFLSLEMGHLHDLKNYILIICIGFQKVIVVLCKIIELIPIMVIICVEYSSYYFKSLKAMLSFTPPAASSTDDTNEDLSNYVLLLEDDVRVTEYSVKIVLVSLNCLIQKAEIKQHTNLLKLLEKSVAFEGVEMFDTIQIQSILPVELVNSWSLPIISLACIAFAIPNIDKDTTDNLLNSVHEGLFFTRIVEESLNKASEYVNIGKATVTLWHEIKNNCKWLETTLRRSSYEGKTTVEIIKSFSRKAEEILNEFNRATNGEPVEKEKLPPNVIAANSMHRITQAIMHTYESNNLEIVEDELFTRLSNMIADILAACFTNIPRIVIIKCNESVIERREDSVMDAVRLIGRATEIIKRLETRVPNMDQDKMAFIDEWRLHLRQP